MKRIRSCFKCGSIHVVVLFSIISLPLFAVPIQKNQAQRAVRGWLRQNKNPMDCSISDIPIETLELVDDSGRTLCHIVNLEPEGFVITSADDELEPVIAFSSTGYYDGDESSPLTTMLKKDMAGRLETVRQNNRKQPHKLRTQNKLHKWESLMGVGLQAEAGTMDLAEAAVESVSEVWVEPFVESLWNQGDVLGSPCYNYYTYYASTYYPTGCVATAMAQVMRYHTYPTTSIGVHGFTVTVNGVPHVWYTRGGNGSGGAYHWFDMIDDPQSGVTTAQREAIGALCYDAGVTVKMSYRSSGSSASLYDADQQMTGTFDYSNSIYTQSFTSSGDDRLWNILNANLDAQMPVMLGIDGSDGGHAVIADGYGYNDETLYHHINMGWGGEDNAWYQLPDIDAYYTFNVISDAVYNMYPTGGGEIISGRVTNLAGAPLENVVVKAYIGTSVQKQAVTDKYGVYALTYLGSNTTYRFSAEKTGETFLDQYVTTGHSSDWGIPGNRSGILFVSAEEGPPTAFDVEVDVDSTDSVAIQLQVLDDGEPDPNLLRCIITSLPTHGILNEPNVGPIDIVPYTLMSGVSDVNYVPCPYFGGQDTFTYKANDGGTYPTGGDSNIATVTVNVSNQKTTDYHSGSNSYTSGMLNTSDYAVRSQMIYLSSEMGSAKRITDLAIRVHTVPGRPLSNFTIRLKHTTLNAYTSLYQIYNDGTTVYQSNETLTSGWNWFHLDTPFNYNGADNLMIDISFWNSGTASDGYYYVYDVGQKRIFLMYDVDGDAGSPLNWDYYSYWDSYWQGGYMPVMQFMSEAPVEPMAGDFDATCDVKLPDLAIFSQAWQTTSGDANYNADCDLTATKGAINLQDLIILSDNWLQTYP